MNKDKLFNQLAVNTEIIKPDDKKSYVSPSSVFAFQQDMIHTWSYCDNLFTPEECNRIIQIGNTKYSKSARVGGMEDNMVNESIRDSKVSWLFPGDNMGWAFERISQAVMNLNEQYFGFDLFGFAEGLQFTRYDAPNGNYGKHVDKMMGGLIRKMSLSIQLNPGSEFKGGNLSVYETENPMEISMQQGRMAMFPSYVLHDVKPVTEGTRYSLVGWITGKPFK